MEEHVYSILAIEGIIEKQQPEPPPKYIYTKSTENKHRGQLPEVRSDSSGDEGDPSVPVQPLNRAQLVEELMNRDYPFPLHRDREGDSSGGFGGSKPASYH